MITVNDRTVHVPFGERNIGFTGDNEVETRQFEISNPLLTGCFFKLDVEQETKNIIDLDKVLEDDKIILTWTVQKEHLPNSGALYAQLRAFDDDVLVWHSALFSFAVGESINATDYFSTIEPTEFEQIEQRVTIAKEEAVAAAESAAQSAEVTAHPAYIADNGNWYIWDNAVGDYVDSGESSRGSKGEPGKSAYEYAQEYGYAGTEAEFGANLAATEGLAAALHSIVGSDENG